MFSHWAIHIFTIYCHSLGGDTAAALGYGILYHSVVVVVVVVVVVSDSRESCYDGMGIAATSSVAQT